MVTRGPKEGLTLSQQISFSTMAYATEDEDARPQLVLVKAADKAYPLYGELITEPAGLTPTKGDISRSAVIRIIEPQCRG